MTAAVGSQNTTEEGVISIQSYTKDQATTNILYYSIPYSSYFSHFIELLQLLQLLLSYFSYLSYYFSYISYNEYIIFYRPLTGPLDGNQHLDDTSSDNTRRFRCDCLKGI